MFYLKVKESQNKFSTLYNFFYGLIIGFPISVILLVVNVLYIFNKDFDFFINWNIGCILTFLCLSTLVYIFKIFMNFKWRKMMMLEFLDIVHNSKIPSKSPKVVYVYTTKNDFMESRLLQNLEQTYSNIEYWISIGDPNDKCLKQIQKFSKKHNIKLHILDKESKSKSDNLNHFLKNSGAKFDYLLIGDADVAFDKKFVENSLKIFYSNRSIRLGFVSSTIFNYRSNNVFTNSILHFENKEFVLSHQSSNYLTNLSSNLYSACCLISNQMLKEMGNQFPNSNLEDWYTEKFADKNLWVGVVSPLSIAMQSFDKNIWANLNRLSRLYTWGIKYYKNDFFLNYNVKYSVQNERDFNNVFLGFYFILGFILGTVFLWFLVINFDFLIRNKIYLTLFFSIIVNLILIVITKSYYGRKIGPTDGFSRFLLSFFYSVALGIFILKNWFKSFVLSKYSTFSNPYKKIDKNSSNWKIIKIHVYYLIVYSIILFLGNFLLFWFKTYQINAGYIYLIILFDSIFFMLFLYELSLLILHWAGKISSNKSYNENDFVYCKNDFVLQTKVINEYNDKIFEKDKSSNV